MAAARNPVLTDLFEEFAPVLRQGLIDLLESTLALLKGPGATPGTSA